MYEPYLGASECAPPISQNSNCTQAAAQSATSTPTATGTSAQAATSTNAPCAAANASTQAATSTPTATGTNAPCAAANASTQAATSTNAPCAAAQSATDTPCAAAPTTTVNLGECLDRVRQITPLVHNITNYVTVNDVANAILACGASPIMSDEPEDVSDITSICGGLNINIGTLHAQSIRAMHIAAKRARELGHVILLDPVGAGASALRTNTAKDLLKEAKPHVLKGNASEIKALALGESSTQGVDANAADVVTQDNLDTQVEFAASYARALGCIVAITGPIDLVTDGVRTFAIKNGRPEMEKITGTGCQIAGIMTAFLVANPDCHLEAAAAAIACMGIAGEEVWENLLPCEGNATCRNKMIDAIYNMDGAKLNNRVRFELFESI
jgi:hydroxyethylthiazole kinase